MCGIAGYWGTDQIASNHIEECLHRMKRRGPDTFGQFEHQHPSGKNTYLLHSRLKIIDLDNRSNQPFLAEGKALAFNGEIYNYLELKKRAQKTHKFQTDSDTEVLMHVLNSFGLEGLDRCEGMWAFAYYDKESGILTLSRDRFGEKPLYTYKDRNGIFFGSEIKFIQALAGKKFEINYQMIHRYLINGYKSLFKTPESFFEGIEQIPSSSNLVCNPTGKEKVIRYWSPQFIPDSTMSYADAVGGAKEKLLQAVEIRLRSDVPLAFCMSGGVDSNSLISIAKRVFDYDVHGFTIVDKDQRYDESEIVRAVAKDLKIRHTEIETNVFDFIPKLRELVRYHDAPVATITYFAHWLLMEAISRAGYKVSLSGTAADELFTGYYDHHLLYLREIQEDRQLFETSVQAWKEKVKPFIQNPFYRQELLFIENPGFRDHVYQESETFSRFLTKSWKEPFREENFCSDLLRNRMMNELFFETVPLILHEDDLNAMYFSIENRSPFLDRGLFEFCNSIPTRHLIQRGFGKAVLRDAVRGTVPSLVTDNYRKTGFNAPIQSFLDLKDKEVRNYVLSKSPIYDLIEYEKIEAFTKNNSFSTWESKFLFNFVTTKLFLEEFT